MVAEPGNDSIPPAGRRLALTVGVNGQPALGRAPLNYAIDDGQDMARVLQQHSCGFTLFRPALLGEHATTSQVRDAVLDLANDLQDDDFALFCFSGHAEAMMIDVNLDDVYLITQDFHASRVRRDRMRTFRCAHCHRGEHGERTWWAWTAHGPSPGGVEGCV